MEIMKSKKNKEDKNTIVIGCGRLGSKIANILSDQGENVLIIDKDKDSHRRLSSGFGGLTVVGDCTDFSILEEAEIENADVVMAVTNDDSVNIMVSQIAKTIYKTDKVIARLSDPEKRKALDSMDIDILCPTLLTVQEIDHLLKKDA